LDILSPELYAFWKPKYDAALEGQRVIFEFSAPVDGEIHYYEIFITPIIVADVVIGASVISIDITERNQAEQALRASEERYRWLIEGMPGIIYTFSDKRGGLYYSAYAEVILGYSLKYLYAHPWLWHDSIHSEDSALVDQAIRDFAQGKSLQVEYRIRNAAGEWLWFSDRSIGRRAQGDETIIEGLAIDITERKQAEEQIKHANDQLRQEMNRRERLEEQIRQTQKMEAIGHLAGGIAHDFNNLLVPIIGYTELSMATLSPDNDIYADLKQIKKAAERATHLTRQILAFSRQQILDMRLLDLNGVILELQKMLQPLIREDIELRTLLVPSLSQVLADKAQIEQILVNLVVNARDAMPNGGKLVIETANSYLDEAYMEKYADKQAPGNYVMIAVSDTGHGMDAETQKHIFDPFFTTKEVGKGTGLGLATVFGIVKQHQGNIWVYSEPGRGSTFKIYLPWAKDTARPEETMDKASISVYGTETILVVEDEEMVRKLVCETLKTHGYTILEAPTPIQGIELASIYQDKLHLLLTDVIMPHMNGRELYQVIAGFHPQIKVLYMSGYTSDIIVHHGILYKDINFLPKPFTIQALTHKIRMVLSSPPLIPLHL
jgi:PAS domain S-box-containing protein